MDVGDSKDLEQPARPGKPPAFSIIIPTYNRPRQLAECLSALTQLHQPAGGFEVIVVDDGGSADLNPIMAPFKGALQLKLLHQPNAGPAAARNHGAGIAAGTFLAFTDDDCMPHVDWLIQLHAALLQHPEALVGGRCINALMHNPFATASQTILDVVNLHFNHNHDRAQFFPSDNIALSKKQFLELGGFDPAFRSAEDRDFCDRWLVSGRRMIFVPEAKVDHAHQMGLMGFIRQHIAYGRGACRFHRAREARNTGKLQIEGSFYGKCFVQPAKTHSPNRALQLMVVLLIWQIANTAGFFYEAILFRPSSVAGARR